jgi:hypothetical protein
MRALAIVMAAMSACGSSVTLGGGGGGGSGGGGGGGGGGASDCFPGSGCICPGEPMPLFNSQNEPCCEGIPIDGWCPSDCKTTPPQPGTLCAPDGLVCGTCHCILFNNWWCEPADFSVPDDLALTPEDMAIPTGCMPDARCFSTGDTCSASIGGAELACVCLMYSGENQSTWRWDCAPIVDGGAGD